MDYTIVVSATASELAPITIYSTLMLGYPWLKNSWSKVRMCSSYMTISSKHAIAYRAMSLLLRRPPGREAYPGDVFHLHSRLLERSAKLSDEYGGGSITALHNYRDLGRGYYCLHSTINVISITDGQIFLETDLFFCWTKASYQYGVIGIQGRRSGPNSSYEKGCRKS